jgi:hypothetical protein
MTRPTLDRGRPGTRPTDMRAPAPDRGRTRPAPRWLRLGIAGVIGAVAGAVLFPTRAEGAPPERLGKRPPRD